MKNYRLQDKETGTLICENLTEKEAKEMLSQFEKADKKDNIYVPDFYEIKLMENEED